MRTIDAVRRRAWVHRDPGGDPATWPRLWWCPSGWPPSCRCTRPGITWRRSAASRRSVTCSTESSPPTRPPCARCSRRVVRTTTDVVRAVDRLLLVDVPDAPGPVPLDTSAERAVLLDAFPEDRRTVLDERATREAIRTALPEHRWVHFSCHGDQERKDPTRGGSVCAMPVLTIEEMTEGRLMTTSPGLGLEDRGERCRPPRRGMALAAALHYTGYRHVVMLSGRWTTHLLRGFAYLYEHAVKGGEELDLRRPTLQHLGSRCGSVLERPHRWRRSRTPAPETPTPSPTEESKAAPTAQPPVPSTR